MAVAARLHLYLCARAQHTRELEGFGATRPLCSHNRNSAVGRGAGTGRLCRNCAEREIATEGSSERCDNRQRQHIPTSARPTHVQPWLRADSAAGESERQLNTLYAGTGRLNPFNVRSPTGAASTRSSTALKARWLITI